MASAAIHDETGDQPLRSALVPLVGTVVFTGIAVLSLCGLPRTHSLNWFGVFSYAVCYVLTALVAHSIAVWAVCRGFRSELDVSAAPLIVGLWMAVAWLPLLWLLVQEQSIWVVAVPPLIFGHGAVFLRRWLGSTEAPEEIAERGLFEVREEPSLLRTVAPAGLSALAVQGAILLAILDYTLPAGLLLSAGIIYPVWKFPIRMRVHPGARRRSVAIGTADVVLLTAIALIPFLRNVVLSGGLGGLLPHVAQSAAAPSLKGPSVRPSSTDYSGIILFAPSKPKEKLVIPPPTAHTAVLGVHAKPIVIPFDGAYWFFQTPDLRPKPDARIAHADPLKANVHSTDFRPLAMEAHQMLGSPIRMDCCSALRVSIKNGDNRIGAINVELVLKDKGRPQSLGTLLLRSSAVSPIALDRPPVEETLTFAIPPTARGKRFDEIAVVIRTARERSRAGARLAVQDFTLVP